MIEQVIAYIDAHNWLIFALGGISGFGASFLLRLCEWGKRLFFYAVDRKNVENDRDRYKEQYESEKKKTDNYIHELTCKQDRIDALTSVGVYRDWLFVEHDPFPRSPICPICHKDDDVMRMGKYYAKDGVPYFQCHIHDNVEFDAAGDDDGLWEKLGDKPK